MLYNLCYALCLTINRLPRWYHWLPLRSAPCWLRSACYCCCHRTSTSSSCTSGTTCSYYNNSSSNNVHSCTAGSSRQGLSTAVRPSYIWRTVPERQHLQVRTPILADVVSDTPCIRTYCLVDCHPLCTVFLRCVTLGVVMTPLSLCTQRSSSTCKYVLQVVTA
jgi:hypothetical protein